MLLHSLIYISRIGILYLTFSIQCNHRASIILYLNLKMSLIFCYLVSIFSSNFLSFFFTFTQISSQFSLQLWYGILNVNFFFTMIIIIIINFSNLILLNQISHVSSNFLYSIFSIISFPYLSSVMIKL